MMKRNIILLSCAFLLFCSATFAGGGWPQKKGKGFFKLNQSFLISDSFYDGNGDIQTTTTISLFTSSVYAEYGLTNRLTAVAYVPFFVRSTLNETEGRQTGRILEPGDEINTFGDTDIGLKYAITLDRKYAVSVSLTAGIPLGEDNPGFDEQGNGRILQTGDGEFNQLIMLEVSRSFYPVPLYATASVGFNNRTNDFSEEFRYGFEIGYTGFKNTTLALKVLGVESLNNGNPDGSQASLFSNNIEYLSLSPEVSYDLNDKLGLSASIGFAASGRRVLASPNIGVGAYFKL